MKTENIQAHNQKFDKLHKIKTSKTYITNEINSKFTIKSPSTCVFVCLLHYNIALVQKKKKEIETKVVGSKKEL